MNWRNFLDDIFGDDTKPGKVMICFVNRYLEGLDGVKYKIKFDGGKNPEPPRSRDFCIEVKPSSFNPIQTYVWPARRWHSRNSTMRRTGKLDEKTGA